MFVLLNRYGTVPVPYLSVSVCSWKSTIPAPRYVPNATDPGERTTGWSGPGTIGPFINSKAPSNLIQLITVPVRYSLQLRYYIKRSSPTRCTILRRRPGGFPLRMGSWGAERTRTSTCSTSPLCPSSRSSLRQDTKGSLHTYFFLHLVGTYGYLPYLIPIWYRRCLLCDDM